VIQVGPVSCIRIFFWVFERQTADLAHIFTSHSASPSHNLHIYNSINIFYALFVLELIKLLYFCRHIINIFSFSFMNIMTLMTMLNTDTNESWKLTKQGKCADFFLTWIAFKKNKFFSIFFRELTTQSSKLIDVLLFPNDWL